MLDQVLNVFDVVPDFDLNLMTPDQSLAGLTARIIKGVEEVLGSIKPECCIVQGDTTTVMAGALVCFYNKVKIAHIEAGLRTFEKYSPFPEEINRVLTTHLCDIHFSPTVLAKNNLLKENIPEDNIFVTGNTVIDALLWTAKKIREGHLVPENEAVKRMSANARLSILVTCHRRENFGEGIVSVCNALKRFANHYPLVDIVFPVHLNPNVQGPVNDLLGDSPNIYLLPPLDYVSFVAALSKCYLVLTDSGGIQEEAPAFGKPVLVMRDATERPEAIRVGLSKLVGVNEENIYQNLVLLMDNHDVYEAMSNGENPYGDGTAAESIVSILKES